jgi:uncharacterized MAPEG superfamily protein
MQGYCLDYCLLYTLYDRHRRCMLAFTKPPLYLRKSRCQSNAHEVNEQFTATLLNASMSGGKIEGKKAAFVYYTAIQ